MHKATHNTRNHVEFSFGRIYLERYDTYPGRPTIVFLHDSLGCVALWRDFPQRLAELVQCNVLVYDRVGYGKSKPFKTPVRTNGYMETEADNLAEVLERCSITKAILFGHSDGGSIALIAAAKYPAYISGIITEGAHIFVEDITLTGINAAAEVYRTTDLKSKLEKYHGDKTEALFRAWTETWTTETFRDWNIEKFLPAVTCPALIIQGEEDEYGTALQVERIASGIGNRTKTLMLKGVHHSPHKETPEQVLRAASEFIHDLH